MTSTETPAEFRERMRSVGLVRRGSRGKERVVTRADGVDAGRKARVTTDELGTVITESDNRRDVNIHPETCVQQLTIGI